MISKAFFETAKKLGVTIVPAGIAVSEVGRLRLALNLYKEDNVHMNPYGAYLVAIVFYSTIYRKQASIIQFTKLDPRRYGRLLQYGDLNKDT